MHGWVGGLFAPSHVSWHPKGQAEGGGHGCATAFLLKTKAAGGSREALGERRR